MTDFAYLSLGTLPEDWIANLACFGKEKGAENAAFFAIQSCYAPSTVSAMDVKNFSHVGNRRILKERSGRDKARFTQRGFWNAFSCFLLSNLCVRGNC